MRNCTLAGKHTISTNRISPARPVVANGCDEKKCSRLPCRSGREPSGTGNGTGRDDGSTICGDLWKEYVSPDLYI